MASLQSRYYNPSWGRFINADAIGGTVGELLSHNIFAYCVNNAVNLEDPSGFIPAYAGDETEETRKAILESMMNTSKKSSQNHYIDTKSHPPSETGYVPPKNKDKARKRIPAPGARGETGWLDKKGRVLVPDIDMDGGEGWRRHYPDGSHDHVYPNGRVRTHNSSANAFMQFGSKIIIIPIVIYEMNKLKGQYPKLAY